MFREDLQNANIEEHILAKKLVELKGFDGYKLNDTSDYDFMIFQDSPGGRKQITYELKEDKYKNENIAIEFFCLQRFKSTGISIGTADWVVIKKLGNYYFIKPAKLKSLLKEIKPTIIYGGDGKNAINFLLKVENLAQNSSMMTCG